MAKKKSRRRSAPVKWLVLILVLVLLATAGLIAAVQMLHIPFRDGLLRKDLESLDMRGENLTLEEYRELQEKLPQCRILWDIPIGESVYSSDAESITLDHVEQEDFYLFSLFENLKQITATDARCYENLMALEEFLPECEIFWGIHLGSGSYSVEEVSLDLTGSDVTMDQLNEALSWFPGLQQVKYLEDPFTWEERLALMQQYPQVTFLWNVTALGKTWLNTDTRLDLAGEKVDAAQLAAVAEEFVNVEELDLTGCGLSNSDLAMLHEAFGGPVIHSGLSLWGQEFDTDTTQLNFSGMEIQDLGELEQIVPLMSKLEKVDLCDCGIPDEEMDALNKRHPGVQFVWKVHFSVYTLRTDATYFCASDLPENGYVAIKMTDEQLAPLKYCTELIALDLGHMRYTDLSFLENMPKLQFLILVEAKFSDISAIGTLKDLIYLEIFVNRIDDLSPLLNCTKLKHLNIGYTYGFDPEVLKQMTQLERLWYPGNTMSKQQIAEIEAALPNTKCHMPAGDPDGSTGAGWREADIYFEMRNIFSMHYMPGGTGMGRE